MTGGNFCDLIRSCLFVRLTKHNLDIAVCHAEFFCQKSNKVVGGQPASGAVTLTFVDDPSLCQSRHACAVYPEY